MPVYERPATALLETLHGIGVYDLGSMVWLSRKKVESLGFQHIAVEMLVKEHYIVESPGYRGLKVYEEEYKNRRFSILYGNDSARADAVVTSKPGNRRILASWLEVGDLLPSPPLPMFVIDMSMKFVHTEEELSRLKVQIAVTLSTIREYLWDMHLAITGVESESREWINELLGNNKVTVTVGKPSELLWSMDADKVIILRPDAPQALTPIDVMSADAFLIGGIVDRIPRPGLSRMLDNLVPWGLPRRIELRGSIAGVPERINRIVEIILKARYKYKGNLEKAIISTMTKKDILSRVYIEVSRRARRRGSRAIVSWDLYWELKRWLPLTPDDFKRAAAKARVELVGGEPS
ncbi:MAG: tRNA (guanine-N1)-methyltransferase [Desulfurococcales archaeon]|nr:tRNA (guanine-N1)-methyltransferase [Desulfurococcales archaeon]